jgi:hypothetical protein
MTLPEPLVSVSGLCAAVPRCVFYAHDEGQYHDAG